jgi:uncharacterized membrane protein YfcA
MTAWQRAREQLDRKVAAVERTRQRRAPLWRQLAHVGALGWLLALPVVLGGLAGRAIGSLVDAQWPALTGLLLGLVIGLVAVYAAVKRSLSEEEP